jgi:hypothetical protein
MNDDYYHNSDAAIARCFPDGDRTSSSTFFWRGFRSPQGSVTVNVTRLTHARPAGGNPTRGGGFRGMRGVFTGRRSRSHQYHPYRRW